MFIYYFFLFTSIFLLVLKLFFAYKYFKNIENQPKSYINEENYTVIQPILSGDLGLEEDLTENLKNTEKMRFIWLIDKSDRVALETAEKILGNKDFFQRTEIFQMDDVPQEINPKIFKISQVIEKVKTKYTIILDDDTVMDIKRINEFALYEKRKDEWIATGIPYNYGVRGLFSKLIAAFVNGNSFLTYFPMAYLKESRTLNGMFYMAKTELFRKYNTFDEIKYELCDDLALATFLSEKKVKIIQTTVFCNVRTTVKNSLNYILLMKRWFLFTKIYIKKAFSMKFFVFILLPSLLPGIVLIMSLFLGIKFIFVIFGYFVLKAFILYLFRYSLLKKKENMNVILYEIISDLILIPVFIYTLITPPVIKWRNKKIRVSDGRIHYE